MADDGHVVEDAVEAPAVAEVGGVKTQPRQAVAELRHRGGVGAPIVVEDEDRLLARVAEVVEALERQAAGEGAITDHRHDAPLVAKLMLLRHREAVGVADHGGRVAVLDPVVVGLGA